MADFTQGDLVVLKSGSMRMVVEGVEGEQVRVLWANEGQIGRQTVPAFALNRWEDRGPSERGGFGDRGAPRGKPHGDKGPGKPYERRDREERGERREGDDRPRSPRPKTGMDGKPRQKTYYRKDE